jgi:hypothetical protein
MVIDFLEEHKFSILLIFVIILLSTSLYVVISSNREITKRYISMILIEKEGVKSEILIDSENSQTIKKTKDKKEVISNIPRYGTERFALPNLDTLNAENTLEGRLQKNKLVWELTFMDSFRYIKYLITEKGYQIDMFASTPQFIELFLSNTKEETYYRIVIFQNSIMKAETDKPFELPEVESYLEMLNSNGRQGLEGAN